MTSTTTASDPPTPRPATRARCPWWAPALVLLVTGLGAALPIGWEAGEWFTFIRHGTEVEKACEDTLWDQVLGPLGALVAGLLVARTHRHQP